MTKAIKKSRNDSEISKRTKMVLPKKNKRETLPSDSLPRKTLEESLTIAQILHDTFAGKNATAEEIAKAKKTSTKNENFKYLVWSAQAYGLVIKEGKVYNLGETGRKIIQPCTENEKIEGIIKALYTPSVLSRFYTKYNNNVIPPQEMFENLLETQFEVPRGRTKEATEIILANLRYAGGISKNDKGKDIVNLNVDFLPQAESLTGESGLPVLAMPTERKSDYSKTCFIITPIGKEGSEERKHSDMLLRHLVEPIVDEQGLTAVRADKISQPGIITTQIIEHIAYSKLCVVDLSFGNPNVFYELAIRHILKLPVVQIIRKSDTIPFDVAQGRTIIIELDDRYTVMDRILQAKKEFCEHVKSSLATPISGEESPLGSFARKYDIVYKK